MVNILVWNVNALTPTVKNFLLKHGSIRGFFDAYEADIICLQETKLMEEKLTEDLACVEGFELRKLTPQSFWAFSQKKLGYSGVATFVRDEWSPVAAELDSLGLIDSDLNGEGRIVLTDHGSFVLLNVYVPNAGKKEEAISDRADLKIRFLHALKEKCDSLREDGRKVIIVGDLNVAASTKDVHPSIPWARMYHKEELAIMHSLLRQYTDTWRKQNPSVTDCYTVWDEKTFARSVNKGLRIDYVLVSPDVLPDVGVCKIVDTPHKWSDHAALHVTITNLQPPSKHEPVPESSRRMKQFDKRKQRSIASMFATKTLSTRAAQPTVKGLAVSGSLGSELLENGTNNSQGLLGSERLPSGASSASAALPNAKRRRQEETPGQVDVIGNEEAENVFRYEIEGPEAAATVNESVVDGEEASPRLALASKSQRTHEKRPEEAKRTKGQAGIRSFFSSTSQRRQ